MFPLNMYGTRDIPERADIPPSVKARILTVKDHRPTDVSTFIVDATGGPQTYIKVEVSICRIYSWNRLPA